MKVLYEGIVCIIIESDEGVLTLQDKNGNRFKVEESEVIILNNLNENI